jgi:hypothetical protein
MRRYAEWAFGSSLLLLIGDAFIKNTDLVPQARVGLTTLAVIAALYWLGTTEALGPWLFSVSVDRDRSERSAVIRLKAPARLGKRKLRQETENLAEAMRAHLRENPGSAMDVDPQEFQAVSKQLQEAPSDEERDKVWVAYSKGLAKAFSSERDENVRLFEGRLRYVLREYERRGLIDPNSVEVQMNMKLSSNHWLREDTVPELEALVRKL